MGTVEENYLGWFGKFRGKSFRPHQLEAVEFALQSPKRVVAIQAPTGSGKSLIGAVLAGHYGDSTYLVGTKGLQEQIITDFPEFALLKGRGNYECLAFPGRMCDTCPYLNPRDECRTFDDCMYRQQKLYVSEQPLRILNYAYFLSETEFAGDGSLFASPRLLVCDEADTLENHLLSFIQLRVTGAQCRRFHIPLPGAQWGIEEYIEWVGESLHQLNSLLHDVSHLPEDQVRPLKRMAGKFGFALEVMDESWIQEYTQDEEGFGAWTFKPVWMTRELTQRFFLAHCGAKVVLMSATFPAMDVYSRCVGIPEEDIDFLEVPCSFDPARRPVYFNPVANMGRKTQEGDYPGLVLEIARILGQHRNEKGMIHTNSYQLARKICSINPRRMVGHTSKDREEVLARFKASTEPLVLVSPSMDRGVSLDGDLARFVIIAKTPFASLGDPQVEQRLHTPRVGRRWYEVVTAQTMEQQAGRGMRSAEDHCEVYFLDTHSRRLYSQDPFMFSEFFRDCVVAE